MYILLIQKGHLRSLKTLPFSLEILSMLQLNDQQLAVHSLWGTKKRMIPVPSTTAKAMTHQLIDDIGVIGDIRPIQVVNNDE